MEIIYHANFDYELELAAVVAPKLRSQLNERFEWLTLWADPRETFSHTQVYPAEYLKHVKSYKELPQFSCELVATHNWWGKLENMELEEKLNSKVFAAALARDLFAFPFESYDGVSEIRPGMVAKLNYSVSGRGLIQKNSDRQAQHCIFQEPLYDRVCDIGTRYERDEGVWRLLHRSFNRIDANFNFRGAELSRQMNTAYDLSNHDRDQLRLLDYLSTQFEFDSIQFDSFLFKSGDQVLAKPLCEINYRRTMIDVAYLILEQIGISEAHFILRPIKPMDLKVWQRINSLCQTYSAVLLNPPGARDIAIMTLDQDQRAKLFSELGNELAIEF